MADTSTNITTFNDSYMMIVWGSDSDKLKILDYEEPKKTSLISDLNYNITPIGKAILAGATSSIAQNIVSKVLPAGVLGRINSSLADIAKDGKIGTVESAEDFISSCNGELDNIATDLGFPTPSALYNALMPDGTGVFATDFLNKFAKQSQKTYDELITIQNGKDTTLRVIKLKLIMSEDEAYTSSLPKRKTEKGFNIVDYVSNEEPTHDFSAIIGGKNNELYDIKDALISIRNSKTPFDVYINDTVNNKQYKYTKCMFENLSFGTDNVSANSKQCSMSFQEIREGEIKTEQIKYINNPTTGRKQKASKKNIKSKVKTSPKVRGGKVTPKLLLDKVLIKADKGYVNSLSEVNRTRSKLLENNILKDNAEAYGVDINTYVNSLIDSGATGSW